MSNSVEDVLDCLRCYGSVAIRMDAATESHPQVIVHVATVYTVRETLHEAATVALAELRRKHHGKHS